MKAHELVAELRGIKKYPIQTTVITKEMTDATAAMARGIRIPPPVPGYEEENPAFPWGPNVWPDPIDCAELDRFRAQRSLPEPGTEHE